jgi:hypothetical protein
LVRSNGAAHDVNRKARIYACVATLGFERPRDEVLQLAQYSAFGSGAHVDRPCGSNKRPFSFAPVALRPVQRLEVLNAEKAPLAARREERLDHTSGCARIRSDNQSPLDRPLAPP